MGKKKKEQSRKVVPLAARGCLASPVGVGYLFPAGSTKHMACNFSSPLSERSRITVDVSLAAWTSVHEENLFILRFCFIRFTSLRFVVSAMTVSPGAP